VGYYPDSEQCRQCAPQSLIIILVIVFLVCLLVLAYLFQSDKLHILALRVGAHFVQAATLLGVVSVVWPSFFTALLQFISNLGADAGAFSLRCYWRNWNQYYRFVTAFAVPAAFLGGLWSIQWWAKRRVTRAVASGQADPGAVDRQLRLATSLRRVAVLVVTLSYQPQLRVALSLQHCRYGFLEADTSVQCGTPEHDVFRAVSWAVIMLIGVAMPLYIFWRLRRSHRSARARYRSAAPSSLFAAGVGDAGDAAANGERREDEGEGDDESAEGDGAALRRVASSTAALLLADSAAKRQREETIFDSLAEPFRPEAPWFETVMMARKVAMLLLLDLLRTTSSVLAVTLALLVSAAYTVRVLRWPPYKECYLDERQSRCCGRSCLTSVDLPNTAERAGAVALTVSCMLMLLSVLAGNGPSEVFAWMVLSMSALVFAFTMVPLYFYGMGYFRHRFARRALDEAEEELLGGAGGGGRKRNKSGGGKRGAEPVLSPVELDALEEDAARGGGSKSATGSYAPPAPVSRSVSASPAASLPSASALSLQARLSEGAEAASLLARRPSGGGDGDGGSGESADTAAAAAAVAAASAEVEAEGEEEEGKDEERRARQAERERVATLLDEAGLEGALSDLRQRLEEFYTARHVRQRLRAQRRYKRAGEVLNANAILAARLEDRVEVQLRALVARSVESESGGGVARHRALERVREDLLSEARFRVSRDEGHKARAREALQRLSDEFQRAAREHWAVLWAAARGRLGRELVGAAEALVAEARRHEERVLALEREEARVNDASAGLVYAYHVRMFGGANEAPEGWEARVAEWAARLQAGVAAAGCELVVLPSRRAEEANVALLERCCNDDAALWEGAWAALEATWLDEGGGGEAAAARRAVRPRREWTQLVRMCEDVRRVAESVVVAGADAGGEALGDDAAVRARGEELRIAYATVAYRLQGGTNAAAAAGEAAARALDAAVLEDLRPVIAQLQQLELSLLRARRVDALREVLALHRSALEILP
jgi:hypothetical protein